MVVEQREHIAVKVRRQHGGRLQRRVAKRLEARDVEQRPQDPQIHRPRHSIDRRCLDVEALAQQIDQFVRGRAVDLQPNDVAAPAPADLAFDELEMGAPALVVQLQLRVPGQPDDRALAQHLSGEQFAQVRPDDVLERDQCGAIAAVDRHEPGETGRHLHDRQPSVRMLTGTVEQDREVEAQRRDQRKRARDVDGERGQNRQDLVAEKRRQRRVLGGRQLVVTQEPYTVRREQRQDLVDDESRRARRRIAAPHRSRGSAAAPA